MIKQHFGPGIAAGGGFLTSSSRKGAPADKGDIGGGGYSDDEEEGLDEREPEKAICPDNSKMLFTALTQQLTTEGVVGTPDIDFLQEFKHQIRQIHKEQLSD